jgi:guanylate kinase
MGASGVGKDALTQLLRQRSRWWRFPSLADRPPRAGEESGGSYKFCSTAEFEELITTGDLIQYVRPNGIYYGLQRSELRAQLEAGEFLVLHMVHSEALKVKAEFPQAILANIQAPSTQEREQRLLKRGDTPEAIAVRRRHAHFGEQPTEGCDLVLVNETGQLEQTGERLLAFLTEKLGSNEHLTVDLYQIWRDNTLLREVAEGRRELTTELPAEYLSDFVELQDLVEDSAGRRFLEENGFDFDRWVGHIPPSCSFLGSGFWLLGRYIVIKTPEIDGLTEFVPEGFKVNPFDTAEKASKVFKKLRSAAPLVCELTADTGPEDVDPYAKYSR